MARYRISSFQVDDPPDSGELQFLGMPPTTVKSLKMAILAAELQYQHNLERHAHGAPLRAVTVTKTNRWFWLPEKVIWSSPL